MYLAKVLGFVEEVLLGKQRCYPVIKKNSFIIMKQAVLFVEAS